MKLKYYVNDNAQPNGDHEVHIVNCYYFSSMLRRAYLGEFESCSEAVREAKRRHPRANGCIHCCATCHTR
jgi:hypothetical protein